jgi:phage/plasmid-like protein (TIGR03299 family)
MPEFTGSTPWANLTRVSSDAEFATAEEMLGAANLDWGVELKPLYHYEREKADNGVVETPIDYGGSIGVVTNFTGVEKPSKKGKLRLVKNGLFEVVRTDNEDVLAKAVTDTYEPYTNHEIFAFADQLVDDGTGSWTAAGETKGGRKVFAVQKLTEAVEVDGHDAHDLYLLLQSGHNGGTALKLSVIPFRLECSNALPLATRTMKQSWSIPHTKALHGRLTEAREALKLSYRYAEDFKTLTEKLTGVLVTDEEVRTIVDGSVYAKRAKRDDVIEDIMSVYADSDVNRWRGTAYGVTNAITEYYQHHYNWRTPETLFASVDERGESTWVTNNAVRLSLALAA